MVLHLWVDTRCGMLRADAASDVCILLHTPSLTRIPSYTLAWYAQDSATAKRVAFDRGVQTRCVTLDGDDFNPGGTLTGGSRAAGGSVLTRLVELTAAEADLASHRAALDAARKALRDMAAAAKQHATCVQSSSVQAVTGLLCSFQLCYDIS